MNKKTLDCFYTTELLLLQGFTIKAEREILEIIFERNSSLEIGGEFFIRFETKAKVLTKTVFLMRVKNRNSLEFIDEYEVTKEFENAKERLLTATKKEIEDEGERVETIKENLQRQMMMILDDWVLDINPKKMEIAESMLFMDKKRCVNRNTIIELFDLENNEKKAIINFLNLNEENTLEDALKDKKQMFSKEESKIVNKIKSEIISEKMDQVEEQEMRIVRDKINEKLNDADDGFEKKIEESKCSAEIKTLLKKELKKANRNPHGQEYAGIVNYLETVLDLPWGVTEEKKISLAESKKILDSHHYGLEKVKERILEILAVRKLNKTNQPLILQGPAGVGIY